MIQRIQTIYLFIVTVLGILLCCFPVADAGDFTIKWGATITFSGLSLLMPTVSLATIFLYKKRILQMRLCSFDIILNVLTLLLTALDVYLAHNTGDADIKLYWPVVIMPINVILLYLAIRAIGKDEALVRSLDRLR
ncbi:MAG: DUF4293 domain-containing protein [Paludibacteraceae bacterium]|nr:DUF4293 domain-containing protein [Paludibacteraceae bacterium]